jgi:hypothetical protein
MAVILHSMPQNGCHVTVYWEQSIYLYQGELGSVFVFVQNETVESYTPPELPSRITDSKDT